LARKDRVAVAGATNSWLGTGARADVPDVVPFHTPKGLAQNVRIDITGQPRPGRFYENDPLNEGMFAQYLLATETLLERACLQQ